MKPNDDFKWKAEIIAKNGQFMAQINGRGGDRGCWFAEIDDLAWHESGLSADKHKAIEELVKIAKVKFAPKKKK